MKLGIIGLDSSHAIAFCKALNNPEYEYYIPDHEVVAAYPGEISYDFDMSYQRMIPFTEEIRDKYGVKIENSIEKVMDQVDAVFLEQVDARKRLQQFEIIASYGKPVFIDKPLALSSKEANSIIELAQKNNLPLLSTSSLRYIDCLTEALSDDSNGEINGADFLSPMPIKESQPGFFWYGNHATDMLFRTLGSECKSVKVIPSKNTDIIVGEWKDNRIGVIRGSRNYIDSYMGVIHRNQPVIINPSKDKRFMYDCLLEQIIKMFDTKVMPISFEEMFKVVSFIEAANKSAETGKEVRL
ncbi:MAG: Gfo/Idh/MocA family oxidoreductase [Clostridiaceae bacterium]|nr:Gfo/Idh/MocA family oxidoreductase [Clostridiaceae bacterium]